MVQGFSLVKNLGMSRYLRVLQRGQRPIQNLGFGFRAEGIGFSGLGFGV